MVATRQPRGRIAHSLRETDRCAGQDRHGIAKMNARVEPPPKRGMGCFANGCLILIAFGILLVAAGIGGIFLSLRHIYLSDKPAPIPEASVPGAVTLGEASAATLSETSV